jgi:hypothetical protein
VLHDATDCSGDGGVAIGGNRKGGLQLAGVLHAKDGGAVQEMHVNGAHRVQRAGQLHNGAAGALQLVPRAEDA